MNRTGLAIALTVATLVGVVFGVISRFDVDLSAFFFDTNMHMFKANGQPWVQHSRDAARLLITLIAAPALLAILGKLILPRRRMLIAGRAALFLLSTLALGPGILAHAILKEHWGRARPLDIVAFGGGDRFTPWWDPRGPCPKDCSFIAGEPSAAFWTLAPAVLAPPQWRPVAIGAALAFGVAVGVLRMAAGAHFFTDVVFAGVSMFVLAWTLHGLLYRWRATRVANEATERALAQLGERLRDVLARRIGSRTGRRL